MTLEILQNYWWLIISLLGALLVFMLMVQGGQSLLYTTSNKEARRLMVNSLGRKWELTFTLLVVFGGAFFAAFPLFYSVSFGGAYWLWMLILASFVLQAVSYEFRKKKGNLYGTFTYDMFLMFNGLVGCVLLGVAVGTFFFPSDFTISKVGLLDNSAPYISSWPAHGIDAICNWRCLLLGFTVFFLARTQAALYFVNNIEDARAEGVTSRTQVFINGVAFAILFVCFMTVLLMSDGTWFDKSVGQMKRVPYFYFNQLVSHWWWLIALLTGVVMVLYGIIRTSLSSYYRYGIWWTGAGTVIVVMVLFCMAGYYGASYLPSQNIESSLTIANSSSSLFTLTVMSYVSVLVPFVVAYIAYVWRKMDAAPLTGNELDSESH
ncbi:MAG: cytochrome d ubiquinol oxidase subunit II, partial [Muribaculaceae bacterium]|nr:cytochrome d ubiquinol oxidase subunit II [Muribaculaceae bacterium]